MKNLSFILLITLFSLTACKKDKKDTDNTPEKPAQTQTGVNILWCKVNGEAHEYRHKKTYMNDNGVNYLIPHFPDGRMAIQVIADDRKYNDMLNLVVNVVSELNMGNIPILNHQYMIVNQPPWRYSYYATGNGNNEYWVDSTISTMAFTRFDDEVVSGTFEYHGVNDNNDTVHITEGFFDMKR